MVKRVDSDYCYIADICDIHTKAKEVEKPKVNVENPFSMNSSVEKSGVFNNQTNAVNQTQTINRPIEPSQPIVNNLNNNVTDLDKTDIIDLDEINRIINNNNN